MRCAAVSACLSLFLVGCGSSAAPDTVIDGAAPGDAAVPQGPLAVTRMRTEYRENPIGLDVAAPRLEWLLESALRDERQTAYRVLAATSEALLQTDQGDLWDSGKVASSASTQVAYAGEPLASRQQVFWKVMVWDKDDVPSAWSANATWEMGLLAPTDWQASWISLPGPAFQTAGLEWIWYPEGNPASSAPVGTRLFRRTFTLPATAIDHALALVTVDDVYEIYVNGVQVGSGSDWQIVQSIDLGGHLTAGPNTIAVLATNNGSPAGVLAQLQVAFTDGTATTLSTDATWKTWNGDPPSGWQSPGFADAAWPAAMVAAPLGSGPWGTPAIGAGTGGGGPARYLRRAFHVDASSGSGGRAVRKARLYVTALGLYEASINGQRIGAQRFTPGWTDYRKRLQYQSYDVTSVIGDGDNVLGLVVGDGWYQGKVGFLGRGQYGDGPIRALAQLELELADGTREVVATGAAWTGATGPIVASDLMDGERYDARLAVPDWDRPGSAAAAWAAVDVVAAGAPALVAQPDDGIQIQEALPARSVTEIHPGVFVYDFGQNMVGWTRLRVQGTNGATVTLRFAEVLNSDGSLYTENLRGAAATDRYTLRGGTIETWEPRFTSHGFRYVELTGDVAALSAPPDTSTLTGIVAHAATPVTGTLTTSAPFINQLQHNIVWSQKGNFTAVPTDCPQRDERLGWMGDAQIFARTATLNMDVAAFYSKWLRDVDDAQYPDGAFAEVAPRPAGFGPSNTPAWGDAGVIVPWVVYQAYGDTRILVEHYPAMRRWVDLIASRNPDNLWRNLRGSDYGDWLNIDAETDKELLATAFYAHSTDLVARTARVLGHDADADTYAARFAAIQTAFAAAYLQPDGRLRGDTQTAYALALRFDLVPAAARAAVGARLLERIQAKSGYLDTGFLGVGHLLPALSAAGATPTAYAILANQGFPSWRYEIEHGATTIWERWNGIKPDGTFETPGMNSFNHYSFGAVGEWMYGTIAGLELDETHPGWTEFAIRPVPGGGLTFARATYVSPQGSIISDWSLSAATFTLTVTIPVNARATVYLPFSGPATLDGAPAPSPHPDGGYPLGSGTYVFTVVADAT